MPPARSLSKPVVARSIDQQVLEQPEQTQPVEEELPVRPKQTKPAPKSQTQTAAKSPIEQRPPQMLPNGNYKCGESPFGCTSAVVLNMDQVIHVKIALLVGIFAARKELESRLPQRSNEKRPRTHQELLSQKRLTS